MSDAAMDLGRERVAAMVDPAALARLDRLVALVAVENERQNLVARSTLPAVWTRHILDSVQLLGFAGDGAPWLDIGTGGGFPGLAIAAADPRPMLLVEPRRRRADFLRDAAAALGLAHVTVHAARVEAVAASAAVISARAVAPVEALLRAAGHCATRATRWLFQPGRAAGPFVASGMLFHVEQSLSDPAASVVVGVAA